MSVIELSPKLFPEEIREKLIHLKINELFSRISELWDKFESVYQEGFIDKDKSDEIVMELILEEIKSEIKKWMKKGETELSRVEFKSFMEIIEDLWHRIRDKAFGFTEGKVKAMATLD